MNNWIKVSSEELEKSKEIIGLKKGELQIELVKALVKIDKAIEYIKAVGVRPKEIDSFVLLEILKGDTKYKKLEEINRGNDE